MWANLPWEVKDGKYEWKDSEEKNIQFDALSKYNNRFCCKFRGLCVVIKLSDKKNTKK